MIRFQYVALIFVWASLSTAVQIFVETVISPQIDAAGKAEVIDNVVSVFRKHYVHLNLVNRIESELRAHLQSGKFNHASNISRFLTELSGYLVKITGISLASSPVTRQGCVQTG